MGYMRIKCHYCGGTWEVYPKTITEGRTCPHCSKSIEKQTWEEQIIPAFRALNAANGELMADHTSRHTPLFEVCYEADTVFKNYRD